MSERQLLNPRQKQESTNTVSAYRSQRAPVCWQMAAGAAIDLYHAIWSPPSRAVRMIGRAVGARFNLIDCNLMEGEHLKPEFLKVRRWCSIRRPPGPVKILVAQLRQEGTNPRTSGGVSGFRIGGGGKQKWRGAITRQVVAPFHF